MLDVRYELSEAERTASILYTKLEALRKKLDGAEQHGNLEETLKAYWNSLLLHKELDTERKKLYHTLDRMNKGVIPKKFEARDLDKIQIRSLARSFYPLTKMSASFINKIKGFAWLRDNNAEHLITETVNASSLSAHVKDLIENEGIDPPDDVVKVNTYNIIGSSKYTPKR